MKKLLTLLLTCGFGLQAVPTWSNVPSALDTVTLGEARRYAWQSILAGYNSVANTASDVAKSTIQAIPTLPDVLKTLDMITLGDTRRYALDGILVSYNTVTSTASNAANWILETASKAAENSAYVHRSFISPACKNVYAGTCETLSAGKDFAGLAKDTGYGMSKFVYDHPQVTLAIVTAATIYYLSRSAQGVVEEQYLKLQKVIDNTLAQASQFELTATHQEAERRSLLSACDIYIPVAYSLDLGWYRNEARAIDEYLEQIGILKSYLDHHRNHPLIQSQAKAVQDAARLVQYVLIKRLNLNAARMVLAKR